MPNQPARIDAWRIVAVPGNREHPEVTVACLQGTVNGRMVTTRPIVRAGEDDGVVICAPVKIYPTKPPRAVAEQEASFVLGDVDPDYGRENVGVRQQFLEALSGGAYPDIHGL